MATEIVADAPSALAEDKDWRNDALVALGAAQVASESIGALVSNLIEGSDKNSFPLLEAINACLLRLDGAVDPVIDAGQAPAGADAPETAAQAAGQNHQREDDAGEFEQALNGLKGLLMMASNENGEFSTLHDVQQEAYLTLCCDLAHKCGTLAASLVPELGARHD